MRPVLSVLLLKLSPSTLKAISLLKFKIVPWVLIDMKNIYYHLQQNNLSANQESFFCLFVLKNETDKSDFVVREIKIAWNTSYECSQPAKARP